jgi:hypothetical protein
MDPAAARALERLRDPSGEALFELARLVVEESTATPLRELATPRWIASQIATALEAITQGDVARGWVDRKIEEGRARWKTEDRPVRTYMVPEAEDPLRTLLSRGWSPDEALTFRVIDQPAMRNLVREVLEDTLTRFQQKLRALDKGSLGGLGVRAARRGKGLLGGMAHNLGGLTENLVGAVTEEFEHQIQARVKEFVSTSTGEALRSIARHVSDPQYARAFGELRLSVLDVLLDTPIRELAAEADKLRPEELVDVVVGALRALVNEPDFVDRTTERVAAVLESAGDGTLGAWLDEVGLREVWSQTTTDLVAARLRAVVQTEAFVGWWDGLFA